MLYPLYTRFYNHSSGIDPDIENYFSALKAVGEVQ